MSLVLAFAASGCKSRRDGEGVGRQTFRADRVVQTSSGDTLVVGFARTWGKNLRCDDVRGYVDDFAVVRVSPQGRVRTVSALSHERLDGCAGKISSALLDRDGALIVSGWVLHPAEGGSVQGPIVTRFRPGDGVDDSFGKDGVAVLAGPSAELALLPDGTIETAVGLRLSRDASTEVGSRAPVPGSVYGESIAPLPGGFAVAVIVGQEDIMVAGFRRDARPDLSFGQRGRVSVSFAPRGSTQYRELLDLVADRPHRKLLVLGDFVRVGAEYEYYVYRFGIDGRLDRSFGRGGRALVDPGVGSHSITSRVAFQSDGRLVAFGAVVVGDRNELFVARYTVQGQRDRAFGRNGVALLDLAQASRYLDYQADGAALPDGKLVVAGSAATRNTVVYRLRADGSIDPMFARGGKLVLRMVPG